MPYKDPDKRREAARRYGAAHYAKNRSAYKARARAARLATNAWYRGLKEGQSCVDCGGMFHFAAMQFDHLPGVDKEDSIAGMVAAGRTREAILVEISKCELVCANCHAVRTHARQQRGTSE